MIPLCEIVGRVNALIFGAASNSTARARARWERDWMPCEDRYVEEQRPHEAADFVVSGGHA